ncbi:ExbD/TolR family protein [Azoarcus olearius]|uniref:Biopolymer transport protein ExbD n=1 Tax=Azoarcus sp. (strain BH72) TaxID=418699 RepID=A1K1Z5_AZOSB|nr:biopolymer transporter ExbD [Azoarcus olearius]ANQ83324.1 putative biopolymer transport protein ExbD [Azoarcus olearius]CAL92850.1 putative biopolymer transport protein ExbD [Azoarcus olearius]
MAMNVGSADEDDGVMSAINTTPLVDVMLVLLIIFLLTIPVATVSVPVELPKETIEARETKPENVILSVDKGGALFWHDVRVANVDALVERLKKVSVQQPQPEVQIRGDLDAAYDGVGRILYACQRAGITKVAFITEPPARGG